MTFTDDPDRVSALYSMMSMFDKTGDPEATWESVLITDSKSFEPRREKNRFLAHLSRRLKGELIVIPVDPASVRPCVR